MNMRDEILVNFDVTKAQEVLRSSRSKGIEELSDEYINK